MSENVRLIKNEDASRPVVKKDENVWELVKVIFQALLIAVVVRTLLFQPFNIPSGSLIPTLLVGDYIFVSKYSYGYSKHSIPFSPNLFSGRILGSDPKRGDVVVFKVPKDNATDYVKRVIGLPGDTVQMNQGDLYINGEKVQKKALRQEKKDAGAGQTDIFQIFEETLPGGVTHIMQTKGDTESVYNNTLPFKVPAGQFFMMGDNRDNSSDSRDWGTVPAENIVGRAEFVFFSIKTVDEKSETQETEPAWQIWRWPETVRWGRMFKPVK